MDVLRGSGKALWSCKRIEENIRRGNAKRVGARREEIHARLLIQRGCCEIQCVVNVKITGEIPHKKVERQKNTPACAATGVKSW